MCGGGNKVDDDSIKDDTGDDKKVNAGKNKIYDERTLTLRCFILSYRSL